MNQITHKTTIKKTLRRITIICAAMLSVMLLTVIALAADLSVGVDGLGVSYSSGTWKAGDNMLLGSATGTAKTSCESASATTSTLTLKNAKGTTAKLSFSYTKPVLGSGGSVKIDGTAVTAAGTFSKELAKNESITVVIVSGSAGAYTSSIELNNIQLAEKKTVTTTFTPPADGGSFTVNGTAITAATEYTQLATDGFNLSATPASGYRLLGWQGSVDGFVSADNSFYLMSDKTQTVTAVFTNSANPTFDVGGEWFDALDAAIAYSQSAGQSVIRVRQNGTVPAGTYTIPSGKTLLVPYDSVFSIDIDEPDLVKAVGPSTPSVFRMLTLADGAKLIVNGTVCVNAKINSTNTSYTGQTTGKYGRLALASGSSVTVNNGGKLISWGSVTGSGAITAESGAKIYEPFVICDMRGGTATSALKDNAQKVFPFSQYYAQNIEAPLTIKYGAYEYAVGSATVQGATKSPQIYFVGSGSGALFKITSGGSFKKTYDPVADRVTYDVYGSASVNSLVVDLEIINLNASNYVLPVMENTTINLHSGTTTVNQDLCLIPGFEMNIDDGAVVNIASGKNIYVYDRDEWIGGKYVYSATDLRVAYYSPTRANANKFSTEKMVDSFVNVNGKIVVNGSLYTTSSGANITSTLKTGKIEFVAAPAAASTTYQANQDGTTITYVSIPVTSAKLHNADGTYTLTDGAAAGDTFVYCPVCNAWGNEAEHQHYFTITYKNYNGDPIGTEQVLYGQMPAGPSELPVKAADANYEYEFASWYPKLAEATQDATYTAEFCAVVPGGATVDDEFDFAARSLTLYESISVNYKLAPSDLTAAGYSDAYVVITLNNSGSKIVAAADLDKSGRLVYQFKRLSPEYMNTTLYAVIYATKDGQLYRSPIHEYSVAAYCYNTLNKYATNNSYAVLRTLLVDLLHYGACSQQYVGYRTNDLADAALTEAQLAQGTNTVPEMTNLEDYTVNTDTPTVTWSGRGLRLEDGVNFRLTFHLDTGDSPATAADVNGLYVKVTNDAGKTWTIRSSAFTLKSGTTNDFQFFFKNFNFSMLSDAFYFTVYNAANEPVSDTLRYSVETYVEKQYNKAGNPAKLKNLVLSILRVGNSAKAWNDLIN